MSVKCNHAKYTLLDYALVYNNFISNKHTNIKDLYYSFLAVDVGWCHALDPVKNKKSPMNMQVQVVIQGATQHS